jgi:hypothetical protein
MFFGKKDRARLDLVEWRISNAKSDRDYDNDKHNSRLTASNARIAELELKIELLEQYLGISLKETNKREYVLKGGI